MTVAHYETGLIGTIYIEVFPGFSAQVFDDKGNSRTEIGPCRFRLQDTEHLDPRTPYVKVS